jgi:hypothetical protein
MDRLYPSPNQRRDIDWSDLWIGLMIL